MKERLSQDTAINTMKTRMPALAAHSTTGVSTVEAGTRPTSAQSKGHFPCQPRADDKRRGGKQYTLPTPIRISVLAPMLKTFPSSKDIIKGFQRGFKVGYQGNHASTLGTNAVSVQQNKPAARQKIQEEIRLGRIKGPFKSPPFPNFKVSPWPFGRRRMVNTGFCIT